eukprot:SAG11_NODE_20635_length_441_cov_1.055556_1_plen_61_part_10
MPPVVLDPRMSPPDGMGSPRSAKRARIDGDDATTAGPRSAAADAAPPAANPDVARVKAIMA